MDPGRILVTGGTRGIGRAIALELAQQGGRVCVTHRWGSVHDEELRTLFRSRGAETPRIEECDASDPTQTERLVRTLYAEWDGLDSVVSGVAFAGRVRDIADLTRESLMISLNYTAWPLLDLVKVGLAQSSPPKRFLALSSAGADARHVLPGYDMVAVSKVAMETLVRYLAVRLKPSGISINVLRLGPVDTESLRAVLPDVAASCESRGLFMDVSLAGRVAAALLGGLLDGMTGQIVTVGDPVDCGAALQAD